MVAQPILIFDTAFFNPLIRDYIFDSDKLKDYIHYTPDIKSIEQAVKDKSKETFDRQGLYNEILHQYRDIQLTKELESNLEKLKDNQTYFAVTAHQLNIFTGPYYYIHKILSTIKLAETSNKQFKDFSVVPVFVMGTEDHDKEEIASINLFNKKYTWHTEQTGATGRFIVDDAFIDLLNQITPLLRNEKLISILKAAYHKGDTLAFAQRKLIHALFGNYGLIIIDLDTEYFKNSFQPIARDEIFNQRAQSILSEHLGKMEMTYPVQAKPRNINIFKLTKTERKYIEHIDDLKTIEIQDISPNVIYRPLMQQMVLPSICYVGGAGELSYWLELKPLFEYYQINFPLLMLRNHAILMDIKTQEKFESMGFNLSAVFESPEVLKKRLVQSDTDIEEKMSNAQSQLTAIFSEISGFSTKINESLISTIKADETRAAQIIHSIEQKLIKTIKKKNEDKNLFIDKYHQKIMPDGHLQERHENFIQYFDRLDHTFFDALYKEFQPFSKEILFLQY